MRDGGRHAIIPTADSRTTRDTNHDDGPFFDLQLSVPMAPEEFKVISSEFMLATKLRVLPEERILSKDAILRCISKIKPLYVKVRKLRFTGPPARPDQGEGPTKQNKEKTSAAGIRSLPCRLKAVPERLMKCRSTSSAVAPRQDDSLLQQQDGIQGAIAHCKKSFHGDNGICCSESPLLRSMSDPGGERWIGH